MMLRYSCLFAFLITFTFVLESCAQNPHICSALNPHPQSGLSLTADVSKLWKDGQTIRVRFLGGDSTVKNKVKKFAVEWSEHADLKFSFGNHTASDIRIAFNSNSGSWSYVGKDALTIPQDKPTMNFGWFTSTTSDEEFRRTTLHEFGHAIGFVHEHQSPAVKIPWDKPKVIEYYKKTQTPPWDAEKVKRNIFDTYDKSSTNFTEFDKKSIMLYSIPNFLTIGNFETPSNSELSEKDKKHAGFLYPKGDNLVQAKFTIKNNSSSKVSLRVVGETVQKSSVKSSESQKYISSRKGSTPYLIINQPDRKIKVGSGITSITIKIPQPPSIIALSNKTYTITKKKGRFVID